MSTAPTCLPAAQVALPSTSNNSLLETGAIVAPRTLGERLRGGAAWVVVGRFLGIAATMLVNVVLARCLTPGEFGEFLVISSVLGSASLLAMLGMNSAVVRFVSSSVGLGDLARARQSLRLVSLATLVSVACVGGLLAIVLNFLDTKLIGLSPFPGLVPMLVVSLMLLAMLQFLAEACRSLQELKLASLLSGGQTGGLLSNLLFLTLIAAAMVVARPGLRTAIALNIAAMAVTLPVAVIGLIRLARERLDSDQTSVSQITLNRTTMQPKAHALGLAPLLSFALPMLVIQLLTSATAQGDLWIAGVSCSHDEVALYGAARRLMLLIAMPLQIINFTVIASIAELHSQGRLEDLQRLLRGAAAVAAGLSIAAGVGLILFGGPTLSLLFGPYFREAAPLLSILVVGQMFLACSGSSDCALSMTGHQIAPLVVNLICGLLLAVLGIWAVRNYGSLGLAYVSATVIAVQSISLWLLAKKLVGVWTHPALGRLTLPV
jgi:O-antigen/teichoic acid export membrane protein